MPCRDMHIDKPPGRGHQEGAAAAGRVEYGRLLPDLKKLRDCIERRRRKNGRREIGRQRLAAIVTDEERISAGEGIVANVGVQAIDLLEGLSLLRPKLARTDACKGKFKARRATRSDKGTRIV